MASSRSPLPHLDEYIEREVPPAARPAPPGAASEEAGPAEAEPTPSAVAPSLDVLARPVETPATYRSTDPRRSHPYRGAVLLALMLAAGAAVAWFAAADVLLAIEEGAGRLRALDSETSRAIASTVLVGAALLSVIVAWGRATSPRRAVRLSDGRGRMAVEAIEARLRHAIVADADVHDAGIWIENRRRRGLRVDVYLRVGPRARIDDAIDRVDEVAEDLLHRRLGVPMDGPPMVDVTYDELDLRAGRVDGSRV